MPARTTASVSMPAARMPSTSPKLNPSRRSMTSMRRVTSVGWGRGTTKSRWSSAAKVMAMSSMFSASRRKSSSSMIVSAKSSTSAGGLASAATGMRPTRCGASQAMTARSWRTRAATDGRCTLTTTGVPSSSVAGVDLGDGGGGQRRALDRGEGRGDGAAQLLDEHPLDDRPRLGRDLVAAPLELGDELGREDPVPRGDDLAQLDVGRAQLLGRHPEAVRDAGDRRLAAAPALPQGPQPQRAAEVPHGRADPPARGQRAGPGEAGDARRRDGCAPPASPCRQASASGSTTQGPWSLKTPNAVSGAGLRHDDATRDGRARTGRRRPRPAPGRAARAWPAGARRAT